MSRLSSGNVGSKSPSYKHGRSDTSEHIAWMTMRKRCYNPNDAAYKNYGGRGITVCDRWRDSFVAFFEDMGMRPKGLTLERIDNDGPYSPENCKWGTRQEQATNRRITRWLTWKGETRSLADWARRLGFRPATLSRRLNALGWTVERTLTEPAVPVRFGDKKWQNS